MASSNSTQRLLLVFCIIVLITLFRIDPVIAEIQYRRLDTKPVKLIDQWHAPGSLFPQTLATDSDVFVVIYATSSYSDVYVLANTSVDPKQLAHKLESAVKDTELAGEPVLYMQGKGYTWADVFIRRSRVGLRKTQMRHRIGYILSGLEQSGLKPHTILCKLRSAKASHLLHLRGPASNKWIFLEISPNRTDIDFSLSSEFSRLDIALALTLVLLYPIAGIAAIPILFRLAKTKRTTPSGRQSLFMGSLLRVMMACMLANLLLLRNSDHFSPYWRSRLQDMWLGQDGLLPLIFSLLLLPLLFMAVGGVISRRAFPSDASDNLLTRLQSRWRVLSSVFVLFGLMMASQLIERFFAKDALIVTKRFTIVFVLWLLFEHIGRRIIRDFPIIRGELTPNKDLLSRLSTLASQFGLDLRQVAIVQAVRNCRLRAACRSNDTLLIGDETFTKLSPEELDFIVAHEFAHEARHHHLKSVAMLFAGTLLTLVPGTLLVTRSAILSPANLLVWATGTGMLILMSDAWWFRWRREEEADRAAFEQTRNSLAAAGAIMKTTGYMDPERIKDLGRNLDSRSIDISAPFRLKWLKRAAKQMNLEAGSAFGSSEQDDVLTGRVETIAASLGVTLKKKVEVVEVAANRPFVNAGVGLRGKFIIGRSLMNTFTPEEVDFVLAHEVAHLKRKDVLRTLASAVLTLGTLAICPIIIFSTISSPTFSHGIWPLLVIGALTSANLAWFSRRRELAADRMALRITRNLPAAVSALRKLTKASRIEELPEELQACLTHPREHYRVQSLRREAKRLGLPDLETSEETLL